MRQDSVNTAMPGEKVDGPTYAKYQARKCCVRQNQVGLSGEWRLN